MNGRWGCCFSPIDVVSWILLYGVISYLRSDNFLVGPLEFLLVDVVQLAVICQALFMIGGYDRNNDTRTLTYMAEHILAIAGAAAISSLLVYAAATFDSSMKPSRSAVLVSFTDLSALVDPLSARGSQVSRAVHGRPRVSGHRQR